MSFTPLQDRVADEGPAPSKLWIVLRWTGDLLLAALCVYVAFYSHHLSLSLAIPFLAVLRLANGPKFAGVSLILCSLWLAYHLGSDSPRGRLRACEGNLRKIAQAITFYEGRHHERPRTLDLLVPDYLPGIPECPNCAQEPYSRGYQLTADGGYTLCCSADHSQAGAPPFLPAYSSQRGLLER